MSRLGLGCVQLGSVGVANGWRRSIRLVREAIDLGVVYFDTADAYGAGISEQVLGRALSGRRADVVLATKGGYQFKERSAVVQLARTTAAGLFRRARTVSRQADGSMLPSSGYVAQDFSSPYLTRALDGSLRRLATEHIDVYQLHGPRGADPDEISGWATRMIEAGKIGRLGIGAEDLDQVSPWLECDIVRSVQVPFGLLDPEAGSDVIPTARASGCAIVVRGVLGAGLLVAPDLASSSHHKLPLVRALRGVASNHGVSVSELALGFVRTRSDVDTILVGTRSIAHLRQMAQAMLAPPPDDVLHAAVMEALRMYGESADAS